MSVMRAVRVIIADDHPVVLRGLLALLAGHGEFEVVKACANGLEASEAINSLLPDVAVLDVHMPGQNGLELLKFVTTKRMPTRVVFLAATLSDREIISAVAAGVFGLLLKESAPDTLIDCLHAVAAGEKWLPVELVDPAIERAREHRQQVARVDKLLTQREREVMLLAAEGLSNKDVARRLNVTEGTVKVHLYAIYQKVAVRNRTALANLARAYRGHDQSDSLNDSKPINQR
jgi:two-component system nitrate/nitrite response regulator NarL